MNWIQNLYETYENCQSMIGAGSDDNEIPLLPICHTTQKAQIEIVLDENGNFRRASVLPKEKARTIIQCTESSAGRTSGPVAHPLCDKLQYLAADYKAFGGEKKPLFNLYLEELEKWVKNGAPKKVQLVYKYVQQGRVIADLVAHNVLFVDNDQLFHQRPGEKAKNAELDIFDLLPGRMDSKTGELTSWQAEAFVRWKVEIPGNPQSEVWSSPDVTQNWIAYYSSTKKAKELCYVTGEENFSADLHPAKIRNDGDKAKIISSNDMQGYTFMGRFLTANQAAAVGFEVTQKAHFTLRWLIGRQGYNRYGVAIVAWATSGAPVPQPTDSAADLFTPGLSEEEDPNAYTAQELAVKLRNRIAGYGKALGETGKVVVMAVDSATTGRMAITYYRDLKGSDFLDRIDDWHKSCAWLHRYGEIPDKGDGKGRKNVPFVGAPAPVDIAEAAYATNSGGKIQMDDNLRKATIARLIPCIVDGQPIPRDLVESVVRKASNRIALEKWQWEKTLSIACALFRKFKQGKEKYEMSLDETRKTRDYLYGRLLAIADVLEERALSKAEQNRPTNATRYMQQFSQRPFVTWKQIHELLTPYFMKLGGKAGYYKSLIGQVESLFAPDDFISNKPLTGEYLLGYYCQRQKMLEKKDKPASESEDNANSNE